LAAAQVVVPGCGRSGGGGESPGVADRCEPVVLSPPPSDGAGLAGGPGDRCGPGEGLQVSIVGKPVPVVADLASTIAPPMSARPGKLVMIWHVDMTKVWTAQHGWVYLHAIVDCCTREVERGVRM